MSPSKCAACGEFFNPRRQAQHQRFCSKPECQRERRRQAKRSQRQADPDAVATLTRAWAGLHPDYWKTYRANHPDYVERNRAQQRQRNRKRGVATAATSGRFPSGRYLLTSLDVTGDCKGTSYLVEILALPGLASDG